MFADTYTYEKVIKKSMQCIRYTVVKDYMLFIHWVTLSLLRLKSQTLV